MYSAQTHGILVEVEPVFLPERSDVARRFYFFAYTVRITNNSNKPCQLLNRHWMIRDGRGHEEDVRGEGVVGEQPHLAPGTHYEYTSACPLRTPTGNMRGSYEMVDAEGAHFSVAIPLFFLNGGNLDSEIAEVMN